MRKRVVITGMGLVNPSGIGVENFWNNISQGKNSIKHIPKFAKHNLPTQVAGQLEKFNIDVHISRRFQVKIDTFTKYALVAANMALTDANLNLAEEDRQRVGVWLGNNAGGWDICERGLYELYREGPEFVNPWQATAWFLSSPQGYLTITHNICGMSKSFVCDRATSASALYFAVRNIQNGENDIILAGGTEAPITPFAMTCYYDVGEMATSVDKVNCYKPFDQESAGLVIAEGAAILILEEYEHACRRGAKIYGEFVGEAANTDANPTSSHYYARAMCLALERAKLQPNDIDVIFAEGAGSKTLDRIEAIAMTAAFPDIGKKLVVTCPKAGYGHLYGASTVTDAICGLLSAQHQQIPPTPNFETAADYVNFTVPTALINKSVHYFMLNSRAREGANYSLIIKGSS